jgi:hypothetical protein
MNNINIERTLKELGTDIHSLSPNSAKLVYRICEICGKEEQRKFQSVSAFGQTKCLTCSNRLNGKNNVDKISKSNKKFHENHIHPRLGVKHTQEALKKMRKNRTPHVFTDEERQKLSKKFKGANNPFFGKKHSDESIKKMSEIHKKIARKGKDSNFYGKTFYTKFIDFKALNGKIYKLKSSWEVKLAEWLDKQGKVWDYEKESFPVSYQYEGYKKDGTYIPDFFIDDEIWEVKGYWRKDAKIKFNAFKRLYPNKKVKILGKQELKDLGIKI